MAATQPAPTPTVDPSNPDILRWDDIGLMLVHNFISEAEEAAMIEAFHAPPDPDNQARDSPEARDNRDNPGRAAARRISRHFGHHFDYTTFNASASHFTPVPDYLAALLPRLPALVPPHLCDGGRLPDQFTVQHYPPGAGIPPHVDTHSAFAEAIYSLSFGSAVAMQFRRAGRNEARKMRLPKRSAELSAAAPPSSVTPEPAQKQQQQQPPPNPEAAPPDDDRALPWELMLPARSLLVMTGASRYGYTHGIRPRRSDPVGGETVPRRDRYSVSMRIVRRGAEVRCGCAFPGVCDARIRGEMAAGVDGVSTCTATTK